jgi:hypothetical protein
VNKSTTQNKVAYLLQGTTLAQALQYGNATLEARFLKLPAEEIDQLCIAEFERRRELVEQWRFYNQPHACADFALFGNKGYWTAPETVALLLDKHSDVVNWHNLREFQAHDEQEFADFQNLGIVHASLNHYLTKRYLDLVVWVARAEVFIPQTRNVDPASALNWARDNNITIPPPLVAALDGKTARVVTWFTPVVEPSEQELKPSLANPRAIGLEAHTLADACTEPPLGGQTDADQPLDKVRRLNSLRELGGQSKYKNNKWTFTRITALVMKEKTDGRKRCSEKTIRADLTDAAENEREERRAGPFDGMGGR